MDGFWNAAGYRLEKINVKYDMLIFTNKYNVNLSSKRNEKKEGKKERIRTWF